MRHLATFLLALALTAFAAAVPAQEPWFEVGALNPGLGDPPAELHRRTPQGAVESFLDATGGENYAFAAHLLDLSGVPKGEQAERGPELARQLATIFDRKSVISWRSLLERPDALNANAPSGAAMSGEPRRSLLLSVLDLDRREAAIRLNRIKPADGDPVWVFSRRTVEQVPALYRLYGPSDLERALPDMVRTPAFWGLQWWEVVLIPITLAIAFTAAWMMRKLFSRLARWADGYWSTVALRALRWPSLIAVFMGIMRWTTLNLFIVSGPFGAVIPPLTIIGFIIATLIFALEVIDAILEKLITFDSARLADPDNAALRSFATSVSAARRVVILLGLVGAIGTVLAALDLYRTVGFSLLASAGALTLILGFAARHVLGNILASLQIALNRSARIGDQIIFNDTWCTVERIHFTYVQLRQWNGNRQVVPVESFVNDSFVNWSMEDSAMVVPLEITLANTADIAAMRDAFHDLATAYEDALPREDIKTLVIRQDALGQLVRFQFPAPDPDRAWVMACQLREGTIAAAARLEREADRPYLPQGAVEQIAA